MMEIGAYPAIEAIKDFGVKHSLSFETSINGVVFDRGGSKFFVARGTSMERTLKMLLAWEAAGFPKYFDYEKNADARLDRT